MTGVVRSSSSSSELEMFSTNYHVVKWFHLERNRVIQQCASCVAVYLAYHAIHPQLEAPRITPYPPLDVSHRRPLLCSVLDPLSLSLSMSMDAWLWLLGVDSIGPSTHQNRLPVSSNHAYVPQPQAHYPLLHYIMASVPLWSRTGMMTTTTTASKQLNPRNGNGSDRMMMMAWLEIYALPMEFTVKVLRVAWIIAPSNRITRRDTFNWVKS